MIPVEPQVYGQKPKFGAGPKIFMLFMYFYLFKSRKYLE